MKGHEFVARARKYAKSHGKSFCFDAKRGKGSHGLLRVGNRKTIVTHGEIKRGTLYSMLKQLGIRQEDF